MFLADITINQPVRSIFQPLIFSQPVVFFSHINQPVRFAGLLWLKVPFAGLL
jgi:hypothetical protein